MNALDLVYISLKSAEGQQLECFKWKKCSYYENLVNPLYSIVMPVFNLTQLVSMSFAALSMLYSKPKWGLYHPLDGITSLKYKFLYFLKTNKKFQRERH